ncbi:MAG: universal stress protein [Vicinamibacterales bacterium]
MERILVDTDSGSAQQACVEQALQLARRTGASLRIVEVLPDLPPQARPYLEGRLEGALAAHLTEGLARLAAGIHDVPVSTALLRGRPSTALIREAVAWKADLLIRSHARDLAEPKPRFGAVDMELLRQCPCPVWLVGPDGLGPARRVLAAVHANPEDALEQRLNHSILELARLVAGETGQLTVTQAWAPFGENLLRHRLSPAELQEYVTQTRDLARTALDALVAEFAGGLGEVTIELLRGEPEDVIPAFVQTHGVDVVVLGTVARGGVAGLLMGNTAERVLQRLHGSVLAVKPPGFHAPIDSERG